MQTRIHKDNQNYDGDCTWLPLNTLGGKAKAFKWRIDELFSIHISRTFKNGHERYTEITSHELNLLDKYMEDHEWVDLANNVDRLVHNQEKDGIGKFIFEKLSRNTADAQLASHLAAIFTCVGVWEHNGQMRNMKFRRDTDNWEKYVVRAYHRNSQSI